jgi:hypothetical protein
MAQRPNMEVSMYSTTIGKIEKARRYIQEPERIGISSLAARFHGSNDDYTLTLDDGQWGCSCNSFAHFGCCAHIMAVQRLLGIMLPPSAQYEQMAWTADPGSSIIGKLEKARRYASEPQRFTLTALNGTFHGSNNEHPITLRDERWSCTCRNFDEREGCAHAIAVQRLLSAMLPTRARYEEAALAGASA